MAQHTEWCQNSRCPEKETSSQIRGTKGKKYYQSNKAYGYGKGNFCTLNCWHQWAERYMDQAIDNLGIRIMEPVKLPMESAWSKCCDYWSHISGGGDKYYLENKLMNIKISITEHQYNSIGYSNHDCMNLARLLQPKQSA